MRILIILLISSVLQATELSLPFPSSEPLYESKTVSVAEEAAPAEPDIPQKAEKKKFAPMPVKKKKEEGGGRNMELAFFQLNRNETDKALEYFKKAGEEGNMEALVEIAAILAREGKLGELEGRIEEISDPDLKSKAMARAAGILSSLPGREAYEKSVTYYMNVITEKNDLSPRALYELGDLMFTRKEFESAISNLVRLVREYSDSEYAQKANYLLGRIFDEVRDKEYARFFYREAIGSKDLGEIYIRDAKARLKNLMPELH